jgi:hypothetical protein
LLVVVVVVVCLFVGLFIFLTFPFLSFECFNCIIFSVKLFFFCSLTQ